jgi:ABC-type multidrug transport system fused ATPase/permease subunit
MAFYLIIALMFVQIPVGQLSQFLVRDVADQSLLAVDRTNEERIQILIQLTLIQAGFWFVGQILWKVRELLNWYCFMRGTLNLRLKFYRHLHHLPLSFLKQRPPGEHLYRATSDIMSNHNDPFDAGLMGMVAWTVWPTLETIYTLAWAGFFLYLVDPWLVALLVLYIIPYFYTAHRMISLQRKAGTHQAYTFAEETAVLRDSIGGLRALKAMGQSLYQRKKVLNITNRASKASLRFQFLQIVSNDVAIWSVRWFFTSLLYMYITIRVVRGEATVGEWLATPLIVEGARGPIERLVATLQSIRIWTINGQRVMQTMAVLPELKDRDQSMKLPPIVGKIEFDNVSLQYDDSRTTLKNISLTIQPGEVIGIVGPSGAGKSTLLSALLRLYPLTEGQIKVDGHDITEIKLQTFLDQCAVIPQNTYLYDGTLRDNFRFAKKNATDEEMMQALQDADALSIFETHPDGLDTLVGDASTLSGGERQRIGVARALIRDPKIMILDEATANLDPNVEDQLLRTLNRHFKGKTVLIVAHRLKAISNCDRIIVLQDGKISSIGNHLELLKKNSWYATSWQEQQEGAVV